MKKISKLAAATALAALTSTSAFAASDGTLGVDSTGTIDVLLQKGNLVQISKLTNLDFGIVTAMLPATTNTASGNACVFSTVGGYQIDVTSAYPSGVQLQMDDGSGNRMDYSLDFNDGTTTQALFPTSSTLHVGGNTVATDCGGAPNVNSTITASVTDVQFNAAPAGIYSDTVTLLVSPN